MNALRLMAVFFRISAMNELAYRANFWFQALESVATLGTALGGVYIVFGQTSDLAGWRREELIALIGVWQMVQGSINFVIAPSLQQFMEDVRMGTLDFALTKPADAQLLVSISQFRVWKLLDVAAGFGVVCFALYPLASDTGLGPAFGFVAALVCGAAIVYSVWLALATLSFWFLRIENALQIFWALYTTGKWPVVIYPGWLRWALTFVVPIAFAVTVPAQALTGRLEWTTLLGAAVLAVAALAGSRAFWRTGLKRYAGASA